MREVLRERRALALIDNGMAVARHDISMIISSQLRLDLIVLDQRSLIGQRT